MIPLPRLLDSSGNTVRRIRPIDVTINEEIIPVSYASMELMQGESVPVRSYIELFTPNGSAGIFRTKAPSKGYGDLTDSLDLDHAIAEVGDYMIQEVAEEELTFKDAIERAWIGYKGSKWALGAHAINQSIIYKVDFGNLLETILGLLEQIPDYYLTFDFSQTPWLINVVPRPATATIEGRLGRNVRTARVKEDDSNLCTRVYMEGLPKPSGSDENALGFINADTISTYGIVEKEISGSADYTEAQALRIANAYLAKHKHPQYSVSISGQDLFSITGVSIDKIVLGKKFRLAMPDYNVTIENIVTKLTWNNVYTAPGSVTVELADSEDPVISFLHKQNSEGGRDEVARSRSSARKAKDTDDSIDLVKSIANENGSILHQAGMHLDAYGVIQYSTDNQKMIGSQIVSLDDRASMMVGKYNIKEENLRRYASRAAFPATGQANLFYVDVSAGKTYIWKTDHYSEITVGRNGEGYYMKAGEICIAINDDGSTEARLDATRVLAGKGALTIDDLELPDWMDTQEGLIAEKATIVSLNALEARVGTLETDYLKTSLLDSTLSNLSIAHMKSASITGSLRVGSAIYLGSDPSDVSKNVWNSVYDLRITQSGNTYTLQKKAFNDSDWENVKNGTFSRAVTEMKGVWGSGTLTVTPSPQGTPTYKSILSAGSKTLSGKTYTVPINAAHGSRGQYSDGQVWSVTVNADDVYNNGYADGKADASHTSKRVNCANSLTYMHAPGKGTSQPTTLYYKHSNGAYYELETGYWYMRDSYMAPTTYYI